MKSIIKYLKNNILLSPIALLFYFGLFIIYDLILIITQIPILLIFLLGMLNIFTVKEIILY